MRLIDADELKIPSEEIIAKMAIALAPTIDPVKHGSWIYKKVGGRQCSECGVQAPFWCFATTQNLSNYCHNCGAKMNEVKK